jgi:ABC-type nickel/cobalt efflux system permease component RcnA
MADTRKQAFKLGVLKANPLAQGISKVTQFTCFTGTKVQILKREELKALGDEDTEVYFPAGASFKRRFDGSSVYTERERGREREREHTHTHTHTYTHTHTHTHTHTYIRIYVYIYIYTYIYINT